MANNDAQRAARLLLLRRSSGGLRSAFNNHVASAERLVESTRDSQQVSALTINALTEEYEGVKAAYEKLRDCLLEAESLVDEADAAIKQDFRDRLTNRQQEYHTSRTAILQLVDRHTARANPQAGGNGAGAAAGGDPPQRPRRFDDSLKPGNLSLDMKPEEFREWTLEFTAWHEVNAMNTLQRSHQQRVMLKMLDQRLRIYLTSRINNDTPLFSTNETPISCMSLLHEEFERCYPLTQKRVAYFNKKHQRGQAFTEFLAELQQLGEEADVHNMGVQETHAFVAICACGDEKLRARLLKLANTPNTNFDLPTITREARAHEMERAVERAIDEPTARAVTPKDTPSVGAWSYRLRRLCGKCNQHHPQNDRCPLVNELLCTKCNKRGHVARACNWRDKSPGYPPNPRSGDRRWSSQSPRGTPNRGRSPGSDQRRGWSPARARAVSPARDQHEEEETSEDNEVVTRAIQDSDFQ